MADDTKKQYKGPSSLDFGPDTLSALSRAMNIIKESEADNMYAGRTPQQMAQKVKEEIDEILSASTNEHREEEVGDALFALTNLSNYYNIDPERALQKANVKLVRRWQAMFEIAQENGQKLIDLDDTTLSAYWNEVKIREKRTS